MSAARRDELVTVLVGKLDKLDGDLASLRELVAGKLAEHTAATEQARTLAAALTIRLDASEARLTLLEEARHRAEGAAAGVGWLSKILLAVAGAAAGFLARHFGAK